MRYSFNIYKDMVIDTLRNKLGEDKVRLVTVPKNNGVRLQGIQLNVGADRALPIIYFNDNEECYSDTDIECFVKEAEKIFYGGSGFSIEDTMAIYNWEIAKNGLRFKLVNYEANKQNLIDKPFVRFMDLAAMFIVSTEKIVLGCGDGVVTVNNSLVKSWGVDKEKLYKKAMKNLEQSNYSILGLGSMFGIMEERDEDTLYVATTYDAYCGATVALSRKILNEACEKMNCERIFILPSSVHEILLIDCKKADLECLKSMVKDVNVSILDPQEYLSDNVYVYECGEVKIASKSDLYEENKYKEILNVA